MTCNWCEERFERLLENELRPADRARLLAHVDACAACRSLLDELRVVDGLLLGTRAFEPAPDFTSATMADVRALPPPAAPRSQLPAFLVCYVIGVWSLIAAGFILEPATMHALGGTGRDMARTIVVALGGVLHVAAHLGDRGELSSWTTVAGAIVILDLMLVATLLAARRFGMPWLAQRQRS